MLENYQTFTRKPNRKVLRYTRRGWLKLYNLLTEDRPEFQIEKEETEEEIDLDDEFIEIRENPKSGYSQ